MKIKIFAVLSALAAITIAAPQYHQIKISGTTADDASTPPSIPSTPNKEIDIKIQISDTTSAASSSLFEDECWKLCFSEAIFKCLDKWHPKKLGSCWTCCKDTSSPSISSTTNGEEIEVKIQISDATSGTSASSIFDEFCSRVFSPVEIECPKEYYPKQISEGHWTCCKEIVSNAAISRQFGLTADL
ncbi:hypothetical protein VE01_00766 [Pseudogymnoascus verrucosus]|uniref:Uncharacterized protein n=1 Tax=Pseudogymnoascus verrucosus TaxID=342668 RepID=A0A2P2SWE8_9PEZI|nr:uncharacterized protein VE01_00766 [Pseudogymnoascus verrucosus]OBU01146.2 hypothetical protein VE01_00766 [Pseudogymnoascus verrucosus]